MLCRYPHNLRITGKCFSLAVTVLLATGCGRGDRGAPGVPLYDNLGSHSYSITTAAPLAQRYFDQGLRLYYAFNHAEAIRAFTAAAELDPQCASCFWGIALSWGPNINVPMDSAGEVQAFAALQQATAVQDGAAEKERALIAALAARYSDPPSANRAPLDTAYSLAMQDLVNRYPDDVEIATLYAESLMDLSPWEYWNSDGTPRPHTPDALAQLERVLSVNPDHPGANHFYIHAVEAVAPARAVPMAERLAGLMPGAGHLVHMPGHIYIRVGRYEDAIAANEHAVHADESYIRDQQPSLGPYTAGYYPHNYDFLAFAASMIGRSEQAMQAAEKLTTLTPTDLLGEPGMTFLQHHHTRHLQMKVRFDRWDDILATTPPDERFKHARGMWHYARGRAFASKGEVPASEDELKSLAAIAASPELADTPIEFNTSGSILALAQMVLEGHVAAAKGDFNTAVARLRAAVRAEDAFRYGEPPEWSIPVRQELGAVLLSAGRHAEAESAFREDLERFPDNGWSLRGLASSLRGQGRDAGEVERRYGEVWRGG